MSSSISISEHGWRRHVVEYFLAAALGASLLLAATAAVNWWIDPFNKLDRNWIGIHGLSERDAKPAMLAGRDWQGVILGSSKTTYIDPEDLACPGVFNASFPGAVPEEMLEFARSHVGRPRFALIGLDFYMFNERAAPWQPEGLARDRSPAALAEYLLSGRVLLAAVRDLWAHLRGDRPRLAPAGNRNAEAQLARHAAMPGPDYDTTLKLLRSRHFAEVQYSERRLRVLARLRDLLERRGIAYAVFINPLNQAVLETLESLPAHADFQRLRRDLRQIFPDLIDLSESEWSKAENYFRYDPYHYLPEVGAAFVNRAVLPALATDGACAPQARVRGGARGRRSRHGRRWRPVAAPGAGWPPGGGRRTARAGRSA